MRELKEGYRYIHSTTQNAFMSLGYRHLIVSMQVSSPLEARGCSMKVDIH